MQAYIFYGIAGSGKGTQRELLKKHLQQGGKTFLSLEIGKLLREQVAAGGPMSAELNEVMRSGGLVPTVFPVALLVNEVLQQKKQVDGLIFDGFGRKRIEAELLVEFIEFFKNIEIHVLLLEITEEEAIQRLRIRKRSDDDSDAIKNRFALFNDDNTGTAAALRFMRNHAAVTFHSIDGVGSSEEVHARLKNTIGV